MKFIDEATIRVRAGNGGNGVAAFRRENIFLREDLPEAMAVEEVLFMLLLIRD